MKIKLLTLCLLTLCLSGCVTTETELSVIQKRLNDPNLPEFERDNLLTRQDFLVFIDQGCLSGDASYRTDLMRQLRYDPDNPELNEKLLLARRDAFNRRDKKVERARRDYNESLDNLRLNNSLNSISNSIRYDPYF